MDSSRHIKPEIHNLNADIKQEDSLRILNMVDIEKVNKYTSIIFKATPEEDILYIPECYKNIQIIIDISSEINIPSSSFIPENCQVIFHCYGTYLTTKQLNQKLIGLLNLLSANTYSLKLDNVNLEIIQQDIIQYLPHNLKRYATPFNYTESLDNLPQLLEFLTLYPANPNYTYAFLPLTLHTLEIRNRDYIDSNSDYAVLPELTNLPPGLKVLSLGEYKYNLASLPEGLEKLLIDYYSYYKNDSIELVIPPNLKILKINKWMIDNKIKYESILKIIYPESLEHLDIDCKVDITKLPPNLKSLGLYGFKLLSNTIELPENIVTVYTRDAYIVHLPAHIKRVIIIINNDCWGVSCSRVQVGVVLFELNTYNTDECFIIE
jgi:hypothetical protein